MTISQTPIQLRRSAQSLLTKGLLAFALIASSTAAMAADDEQPRKGKKVKPARIVVNYDIKGAAKEAKIFVQHIGGRGEIGTAGSALDKWSPVKNGGSVALEDLGSGKYQVARRVRLDVAAAGPGRMLIGVFVDRHRFELKYGQTKTVNFVRKTGQPLQGKIENLNGIPNLDRAAVLVCSDNLKDHGMRRDLGVTIFDARMSGKDGKFQTDILPPGDYKLVVEGFETVPQSALLRTGSRSARYVAVESFTIPKKGKSPALQIKLRDIQAK